MSQQPSPLQPLKTVGRATRRIDAVERVTGKANYTGDLRLPGMLYARILRSPHPHARIVSVESRHAAWIRDLRGMNPAPDAAEPAIEAQRVIDTLKGSGY